MLISTLESLYEDSTKAEEGAILDYGELYILYQVVSNCIQIIQIPYFWAAH